MIRRARFSASSCASSLDVPHAARRLLANLRLDTLEKQLFGLLLRQAAQALQLRSDCCSAAAFACACNCSTFAFSRVMARSRCSSRPARCSMFFFPLIEPPLAALQPPLALTPVAFRRLGVAGPPRLVPLRAACRGATAPSASNSAAVLVGLAYSRLTPPLAQYGADSEREARYHDTDNKAIPQVPFVDHSLLRDSLQPADQRPGGSYCAYSECAGACAVFHRQSTPAG